MNASGMRVGTYVRWRRFDSEVLLLDLRVGQFVELNEVAARAFEGVARGESLTEIVDDLAQKFVVDRTVLEDDVRRVLDDLVQRGLVEGPP
jgi:hypothetical protein